MSKSDKSSPPSNRHKKKIIREGLQTLKGKAGWDIEAFRSPPPEIALRDFDQQFRQNRVFSAIEDCDDCQESRRQSGDETALCAAHLAAALGFEDEL